VEHPPGRVVLEPDPVVEAYKKEERDKGTG
jgi:hypothetical protein